MFYIKCANILIQVNNRYELIREKCKDYITKIDDEAPQIIMEPSDNRIQFSVDYKRRFEGTEISLDEAEYDAAPYPVYHQFAYYDAFWLHAALIEVDGKGYAFTAYSGCGKSTHVGLWKKAFGDEVSIINGDNPIVRLEDGVFIAYGTPFCGKEGWQINKGVRLCGICFLERATDNRISPMDTAFAYARLLRDNFNITPETLEAHMELYEKLVEQVPVYKLECNMEIEAAKVARRGLIKDIL
jgi:hypothetical protein